VGPAKNAVLKRLARRSMVQAQWGSRPTEDPNELAATLYLWADEAARYGHVYSS